jgi:hypothetical protein
MKVASRILVETPKPGRFLPAADLSRDGDGAVWARIEIAADEDFDSRSPATRARRAVKIFACRLLAALLRLL